MPSVAGERDGIGVGAFAAAEPGADFTRIYPFVAGREAVRGSGDERRNGAGRRVASRMIDELFGVEVVPMRVVVDFDLCESNALCMGLAPEVFEVRDDDLLYVLDENPPEEMREQVQAAVRTCPKNAISIED